MKLIKNGNISKKFYGQCNICDAIYEFDFKEVEFRFDPEWNFIPSKKYCSYCDHNDTIKLYEEGSFQAIQLLSED